MDTKGLKRVDYIVQPIWKLIGLENGSLTFEWHGVALDFDFPIELAQFKAGEVIDYTYMTQMKSLYGEGDDWTTFKAIVDEVILEKYPLDMLDTKWRMNFSYRVSLAEPDKHIAPNGNSWVFMLNNPCHESYLLNENPRLPSVELIAYIRTHTGKLFDR